jgi:membrane-bound lytic murein transglycosylase B
MNPIAGQLSNFQFVFMMCAGVMTILGVAALIINAFKAGRREGCVTKFNQQKEGMMEMDHKREINAQVFDQRFKFIEQGLSEIKTWQQSIDVKMDKIFEVINSLPKRKSNGKED